MTDTGGFHSSSSHCPLKAAGLYSLRVGTVRKSHILASLGKREA